MSTKKIFIFIMMLGLFFSYPITSFSAPWVNLKLTYDGKTQDYSAESVYLYVNGKRIENLSMPAIIMNGSTLVPAREVFEPLSSTVEWKEPTAEVIIKYKSHTIILKINSSTATVDNNTVSLPLPAKIINKKTMIPARFIAQSLGMKVEWDAKTRIINIRDIIETPANNDLVIDPIELTETTSESTTSVSTTKKETITETTTEIITETATETTTEKQPVNLSKPECSNGVLKITADGTLGDFATIKTTDKELIYHLSKTNLPKKVSYTFKDEYVKEVNFSQITINNKKFTKIVIQLNKSKKPAVYISNENKSFIIDFVNDAPEYKELYVIEEDDSDDIFDSDIDIDSDAKDTNENDSDVLLDETIS